MKKIIFMGFAIGILGTQGHAVMPPSTSLEESMETSAWKDSGGRYQVLAGKVAMFSAMKGQRVQVIETFLKLDRETGKTWMLQVITSPGGRPPIDRWIEIESPSL